MSITVFITYCMSTSAIGSTILLWTEDRLLKGHYDPWPNVTKLKIYIFNFYGINIKEENFQNSFWAWVI